MQFGSSRRGHMRAVWVLLLACTLGSAAAGRAVFVPAVRSAPCAAGRGAENRRHTFLDGCSATFRSSAFNISPAFLARKAELDTAASLASELKSSLAKEASQ